MKKRSTATTISTNNNRKQPAKEPEEVICEADGGESRNAGDRIVRKPNGKLVLKWTGSDYEEPVTLIEALHWFFMAGEYCPGCPQGDHNLLRLCFEELKKRETKARRRPLAS